MYNCQVAKVTYSIATARAKLSEIVDGVEAGNEVELVRRGKKVAVLVSPSRYARLVGKAASFGEAYDAFTRSHDLEELGLDRSFSKGLRDQSTGRAVKFG